MNSPESHNESATAVEGRDGWLFLKSVGGVDVLDFYTSEEPLPGDTIERWVDALSRRRSYFEDKGIAYQTVIVPDAHLVYRDKLPEGVQPASRSPYDVLDAALDPATRAQVVYLRDALVAGRERAETYQAVDSHWSDWGAWLGYHASVSELASRGVKNVRPLADSAVAWSTSSTSGALGDTFSPPRTADVPIATILKPGAAEKARVLTESRQAFLVVEKNTKNLPTAVVFRDSFMTSAARFYAENFRRVVFVDSANTVFHDLVEWESPDVVIHEMSERTLAFPPAEPSTNDFRAAFGDLMLDNPHAEADQRMSRSLLRAGRADEALASNDAVLRQVPPTARLMLFRAWIHLSSGQLEAALEALRHATTLDPKDAAPWCQLGQILDLMGRVADAAPAYAHAARAQPELMVYWQLAISAALRADDQVLLGELRAEATERYPDIGKVAQVAEQLAGRPGDQVEEEAAKAARLQPTDTRLRAQLLAVQLRRGNWEGAAETLGELKELAPDNEVIQQYGKVIELQLDARRSTEGSP